MANTDCYCVSETALRAKIQDVIDGKVTDLAEVESVYKQANEAWWKVTYKFREYDKLLESMADAYRELEQAAKASESAAGQTTDSPASPASQ